MSDDNIILPGKYSVGLNLPANCVNNEQDWSNIIIPEKIELIEVSSWNEFFGLIFKEDMVE